MWIRLLDTIAIFQLIDTNHTYRGGVEVGLFSFFDLNCTAARGWCGRRIYEELGGEEGDEDLILLVRRTFENWVRLSLKSWSGQDLSIFVSSGKSHDKKSTLVKNPDSSRMRSRQDGENGRRKWMGPPAETEQPSCMAWFLCINRKKGVLIGC